MNFTIDSPYDGRIRERRQMPPRDARAVATTTFSTGQVSGRLELPNRERAWQMVALTRDFHVLASGVTTGFSAIFFAIRYIAQARYVCALLGPLSCHYDSYLFRFIFRSYSAATYDVREFLDQPEYISRNSLR